MNAKAPPAPTVKFGPYLTRAQRQTLQQRQRFRAMRNLQRDAKAGDTKVWKRLSNDPLPHHKYWKELIRDRLKDEQEPRCCYCKRWLLAYAHATPIEHVLPSSRYPARALRLRNLALACHDCNYLKGDSDWNEHAGPYRSCDGLGFFHPRYHAYDEHIQYIHYETNDLEYIAYQGLTTQGRHLCRALLSDVVGKKRLVEYFPGLRSWTQAASSFAATPQGASERPQLDSFARLLSQTVTDQLADGAKISAMWVRKSP
ncbi:hypothetical protein N5D48_01965 [Pseudomonas sp. GD03858]|uniref:HNH endonuclease n=1 Tax=unclassified Pseudomonas TaxID=196821 RepID=UPI002449113B|nr:MULTISPECIES: hypothetical protein [unclassified Pseudomonas]MDH0645732.1 hypothetical protein [Pseudomonas sp. GD03867]MDH0661161.1 hypothetical protein [Pseudomonas sp. GD03858]